MANKKPNILVLWGGDIGWYNISRYNLGQMGYETLFAQEGSKITIVRGSEGMPKVATKE